MLDNNYLAQLPKNKLLAANQICIDYQNGRLSEDPKDLAFTLKVILDGIVPDIDKEIFGNHEPTLLGIPIRLFIPSQSSATNKITKIHRYVKALLARETIENPSLINTFLISLSGEEKTKIDKLLSQIRNIIRNSTAITDEYKRRLLKVINALQTELDKEYSDYRVFLDGMVEVSEAVGEAGKNIKPIFDRFKELFGIADRVRKMKESIEAPANSETLPAPPKQLPPPEDPEAEGHGSEN